MIPHEEWCDKCISLRPRFCIWGNGTICYKVVFNCCYDWLNHFQTHLSSTGWNYHENQIWKCCNILQKNIIHCCIVLQNHYLLLFWFLFAFLFCLNECKMFVFIICRLYNQTVHCMYVFLHPQGSNINSILHVQTALRNHGLEVIMQGPKLPFNWDDSVCYVVMQLYCLVNILLFNRCKLAKPIQWIRNNAFYVKVDLVNLR